MKRTTPLKRSGWSRTPPPREKAEVRPSSIQVGPCRMFDGKARLDVAVPVPKFEYVRDTRYRDACRALACQHCGAAGPAAGVTWAHSNWAEHGKGKSVKASDCFVAALCHDCHGWLDQGKAPAAVKRQMWDAAHAKTIREATTLGLWPATKGT